MECKSVLEQLSQKSALVLISKNKFGGDTQYQGLPGYTHIHSLFTPSAPRGLGQEEESELDSAFERLSVHWEGLRCVVSHRNIG